MRAERPSRGRYGRRRTTRRIGAVALVVLAAVGWWPQTGTAQPAAGEFRRGSVQGRAYRLWVPEARAARGPLLVVALHGCWQTAEEFALGTRLNEAAGRRGLFVLYPVQDRRDNALRCWNWFSPENHRVGPGPSEIASILGVVREIQRQYTIGDSRLLVIGLSAGAFMAVNLACAAPDLVVGLGVTAGGPFRCAAGADAALQCVRGRTGDATAEATACRAGAGGRHLGLRASLWHGEADEVVSAANLPALLAMLALATGVAHPATESRQGATVTVYRDPSGRPVLEGWLVAGMGHAWSGGDGRASHTYPTGPNATERILEVLLSQ